MWDETVPVIKINKGIFTMKYEETTEKTFEYTYSAKQQEEISAIRKKYLPPEENKLETLRKLDRSVEQAATTIGLVCGIIGTLIMGSGMSLCLVLGGFYMIPGILLGVIGIIPVALAYPAYMKTLKKKREQVAPQILALTEELSK